MSPIPPHLAAPRARHGLRSVAVFGLILALLCRLAIAQGVGGKRSFDVPAQGAELALKLFSDQAGKGVIMNGNTVQGIRTNRLKGEFTPVEGLQHLLAGTGLIATSDDQSGSFVIHREVPAPNGQRAAPTAASDRPSQNRNGATSDDPAPIELSPFVVSSKGDEGYSAYSTLAGSRLNTPLKDTASSISVLTSEFLSDVGANNLSEALQWAANVQQDFNDVQGNDNESILGPASFRVRGLPATLSRNYFPWRLSTDSFNLERIEENRGPNSVLFGIGSAGGIINSSTKQASTEQDFRRAAIQTGSFGSLRGSIDINQALLDRKLAVRFNAVKGHTDSWRHHVKNDTTRAHLAISFQVRPTTRIRGEFEIGDVESLNARNTAVYDGISPWIVAGRPTIAAPVTNAAQLTALGLQNFGNTRRVTYVANNATLVNYQNQNHTAQTQRSILDEGLASRTINTGGPGQVRFEDYRTYAVYLEQRVGKNTFVELANLVQQDDRMAYISGQGRFQNNAIKADPHRLLPTGQANPFVGRTMFEGDRSQRNISAQKLSNLRLSISHELKLGKWGDYRLAVMGDYEKRKLKSHNEVEVWAGAPFSNASPEAQANVVTRRNYVTDGRWDTYYLSGPAETGLIQNIPNPVPGGPATLSSTWAKFNQNIFDTTERQKTFLLGAQARYFGGRLVFAGGFRKDKQEELVHRVGRDPVTQEWALFYDAPTREDFSAQTKTFGIVGHATKNISLFYNQSNSFQLPQPNQRVLPHSGPPPPPESEGRDYGLRFSFFNERFNARINYYEVSLTGGTGGGGGSGGGAVFTDNPTVLSNRIFSALVAQGLVTQGAADARQPNTNTSLRDRRVEGYEFTLNGNLTKNWRIQMSYAYTDGFDSNIAPEIKDWSATALPFFLQYPNVVTGGGLTVAQEVAGFQDWWNDNWAVEGLFMQGNRRHKGNVFTRYSFSSGFLRGAFIGGGYRYAGKSQLELLNPGPSGAPEIVYGNSYWLSDVVVGYQLRNVPFLQRSRLSLQLNIANVFDWNTPIVAQYQGGGQISRWSILEPRIWRLSAKFSF